MPKKTKKKTSINKIAILVLVLVLIAAGSYALWHHYHKKTVATTNVSTSSKINYSPSTPKDNAANNSRKASSNPAQTLVNGPSDTASVPISITVTRAGVVGSDLEVGTLVNGASSGSCTLSVSQSGQQTVTKTENVQQQTNSYGCPVFDVPTSSFPNQGNWNISVTLNSGGQTETGQWQANPVNLSNNE